MKPHLTNTLAFSGILLGTIGAAILYQETVLSDEEIAIDAANISNKTERIELQDWLAIAFNALAGSLVFFNYVLLVMKNHSDLHSLRSFIAFTAAILISLIPPIITYIIVKLSNAWQFRRASLFDPTDFAARKKYITHRYRLMGVCFVVLGGWAQIPLILASSCPPGT